jgi:hypothetical protein
MSGPSVRSRSSRQLELAIATVAEVGDAEGSDRKRGLVLAMLPVICGRWDMLSLLLYLREQRVAEAVLKARLRGQRWHWHPLLE